jgi:hypothetical protein
MEKIRKGELHNLFSSPYTDAVIKSRWWKWKGMGKDKIQTKFELENPTCEADEQVAI